MRAAFVGEAGSAEVLSKDRKAYEKEMVIWCDSLYSTSDEVRRKYEPDWYSNCLFFAGNQFEQAANDIRRADRRIAIRAPQSKIKLVINQILPLVRQSVSALRDNLASQKAMPATSRPEDVLAAALATDILNSRYYNDDEFMLRYHELLWCMTTGRVTRKTYWEPDKAGDTAQGRVPGLGDIQTEMVNPFKLHFCPWNDAMEEPDWIIESEVADINDINDQYPGKEVKQEGCADATRFLDRLLNNIMEGGQNYAPKRKDAAILKKLYIKPRYDLPEGRYIVWANGQLLYEDTLPEGQTVFHNIDWLPIPGRAYPQSFITPLRDPQRETNITISQVIELKNRQLRGDVITRGHGKVTQMIDPETGAKQIHVPAGILEFQQMLYNANPTEAELILSRLWNEMMQISGVHEQSLGQAPGRAATATQIQVMKEADLAGLTLFRGCFDQVHCKIASLKLLIIKNHYKMERIITLSGDLDEVRTTAFYGVDLRDTNSVRPQPFPMLSEALKVQLRREAAIGGLYGPFLGPQDMLAKVTALANYGIPNVEQEIKQMIAPMSLADLRSLCAQMNIVQAKTALLTAQAQLNQMALQHQQQGIQAAQMEQIAGQLGSGDGGGANEFSAPPGAMVVAPAAAPAMAGSQPALANPPGNG